MSSRVRPGDVVSRRKGLVMHRGISLGDGRVLHIDKVMGGGDL